METTYIPHLLKSLCDHTHWSYAVFWKLNRYLPMALTWEDGYYGCQKANGALEIVHGDINFEDSDSVFSTSNESTCDSGADSVQPLMAEMSNLKYFLGEGIVGEIALKGIHCWVSCQDVLQCPYEWLFQFASGIKTIVLVPVLPHGVLQFGSFVTVVEDLMFVANVKDKFNSMCSEFSNTTLLSSDIDIQPPLFSSLSDCLMDNSDESSSISNNKLKDELYSSTPLNGDESTRLHPTVPLFFRNECHVFGEDPGHIGQLDTNLNQTEEKSSAFSWWVNDVGLFDERDMTEQRFGGTNNTDHKVFDDVHGLSDVSLHCDLYKTLGPTQKDESLWKYFPVEDTCSSSTLILDGKGQGYVKDSNFLNEDNSEYLLDAVVGSLESALDDSSLSVANDVKPPVTLPRECSVSIPPQSHHEESTLMVNCSDHENHVVDDLSNLVSSKSLNGNSSILIDEAKQAKSGPKLSRSGKKRAKVGNTKKPRPRDRQLIMDRMKELRDLVPDGTRCSIDSLLERTIKHMLYLRKTTYQAEKLERCLLQEVPEGNKQKTNDSHSGRSFAFDFESENQVCPLIIKDFGCSGNMLIEMICSEHGLFLEIADVIRQLELTILKGALESRSGTMWACFIVEVPRGFHRMDIMYPLLHVLQQKKNNFN